jgi:hypothetical protein
VSRTLPALMTPKMISAETGLSDNEVRALLRHLPRVKLPHRKIAVKRRDVEAALQGRMSA